MISPTIARVIGILLLIASPFDMVLLYARCHIVACALGLEAECTREQIYLACNWFSCGIAGLSAS